VRKAERIMTYEYKMIQSSQTVLQDKKQPDAAAKWMEDLSNEWAGKGWEFYRVDTMAVHTPGGCLTGGTQGETHTVIIVTFRKPR
jgi:hypothetical protein